MLVIKTGMAPEYKVAKLYAAPGIIVLTGLLDANDLAHVVPSDCKAIISFGLCGGLFPSAAVGQGYVCGTLVTPEGEYIGNAEWAKRLTEATGYPECRWWSSGLFNTANNIWQRCALYSHTQALVIDDETYAVAKFAKDRGIAFQALRVVSDGVNDDLPPAVRYALNANGTTNIEAVIESVEHDPRQVPSLLKTAYEYGKSLAELRSAAVHVGATFQWI